MAGERDVGLWKSGQHKHRKPRNYHCCAVNVIYFARTDAATWIGSDIRGSHAVVAASCLVAASVVSTKGHECSVVGTLIEEASRSSKLWYKTTLGINVEISP